MKINKRSEMKSLLRGAFATNSEFIDEAPVRIDIMVEIALNTVEWGGMAPTEYCQDQEHNWLQEIE